MITSHVFIVDVTTFKHHLEYKFVGTGAANRKTSAKKISGVTGHSVDFNNASSSILYHSIEKNLVEMI